jgi:hypothetical protein
MMIEGSLTYGDIKEYILEFITKRLAQTENELSLWNKETMKFKFHHASWNNPFPGMLSINQKEYPRIKKAKRQAELEAADKAIISNIKYLAKKLNLSDADTEKIHNSEHAKKLMIHSYYLNALIEKILELTDLINCSLNESNNLNWVSAIALMKEDALTFTQAKDLNVATAIIILNRSYFSLLKAKKIHFEDLKDISLERSIFLIHPHIVSLVTADNNALTYFVTIPKYLQKIFLGFSHNHFIENNILSLATTIALLSKENPNPLLDICVFVYVDRLQKMAAQKPYTIDIGGTLKFMDDLAKSSTELNIEVLPLKEIILSAFFANISKDLQNNLQDPHDTMANRAIYQTFFNIVSNSEKNAFERLNNLLQYAEEFIMITKEDIAPANITFFPPEKKRRLNESKFDRNLYDFCVGIGALDSLNEKQEQKITYQFM